MTQKTITMQVRKRIAVVWNIPVASDRATADFIFSSPLMSEVYTRSVPDYDEFSHREIPLRP